LIGTTADQIRTVLQGGGGNPFAHFVDTLLRTHCRIHNVSDSEVDTNVRVEVKDGGVDTEVRVPIPTDTQTQWFSERTIWQYKGSATTSLRLSGLVKGAHLRKRIEEGWAYRLAVADSMTAQQRKRFEDGLTKKFRGWNVNSPAPRIVTADELAEWANRYVGLVLATFFRDLVRDIQHFDSWGTSVRGATPTFVEVPAWAPVTTALTRHVDFAAIPGSAVCTVQGEAGVGKSRLAYETLRNLPGANGLVVYAMDDSVMSVARHLANDSETRAVVVADECDTKTRLRLAQLLDGHRARVRVIAIDNTLTRPDIPNPELSLVKMPRDVLELVLERNFPEVDDRRRRAYVSVSDGFPRLAADLCLNDAAIASHGDFSPAIPLIANYYRARLTPDQQRAVAAISLVSKIGYTGDLAVEFDTLCQFLRLSREETLETLDAVHDGPGFVTRSGRYLQVTPELVAQVSFEDAWRRWAQHDAEAFLNTFPQTLIESFLTRVWRSAPEEVRHTCAAYFREWAERVQVADLTSSDAVQRFVTLVDTHPSEYLPMLRRLVERATISDLAAVTGESNWRGEWGSRRALVWLAERFAQLPEHFDDAERILARLAAAESEPNIANNATAIWGQGFRVFLSGTATPFADRLMRLRERLRDDEGEVRRVARTVLGVPISTHAMRMAGPVVVGGRIPPAEWRPETNADYHSCVLAALTLFREVINQDRDTRTAVVDALCEHLRPLISQGYLAEIRTILDEQELSDDERVALLDMLDSAVEYDIHPDGEDEDRHPYEYVEAIRSWHSQLQGTDLHSRLVAFVGRSRWGTRRLRDEVAWTTELEDLARDFADAILKGEYDPTSDLSWLATPAAQAAGEFGEALGRADRDALLFQTILGTVLQGTGREIALASGYARGLLRDSNASSSRLNEWLDLVEETAPEIAAQISISAGEHVSPLKRVLRLYDEGRIGARFLYSRNFPLDESGRLSAPGLLQLLVRLAKAAEDGDATALRIGLDNLTMGLPYHAENSPNPFLAAHPDLRAIAWRLLDASLASDAAPSNWWDSLILHLSRFEPARAARFVAELLRAGSLRRHSGLERAFTELATSSPAELMEAVGTVILGNGGVGLLFGDHKRLFAALPDAVKRTWLEQNGVVGARRMARHLAPPYVAGESEAAVPALTEWVLETFEKDDEVFNEFVAGTYSLRIYSGDIAAQHEQEAALARGLRDHRLRRVREWAAIEERRASADAARERIRTAEQDLE
jgi:hypothetical protein